MAIAKLSIDLEARLARLEQDMGRATKIMEREAGKMERAFSTAGAGIKGALSGVLGALSVGAVTSAFSAIVRGLDNLNDSASALGTTVENLSALEDIAARTGTQMETVTTAMVKFNAQIQEGLKPGTEAARVFELLGLNAKELAELDPAEALLKTAQALATFSDDGNKARVVYALFGKSMAEVAELLKNVADAGKLNATVTTEQAKEAAKFADEVSSLQKSFVDLARTLGGPVISELNRIIQLFRDGAKEGRSFWHVLVFGDLNKGRTSSGGASGDFGDDNYSNEGRNRRSIGLLQDKPKQVGGGRAASKAAKVDIFGPDLPDAVADAIKRIEGADENKLQRLRDTLQQLTAIVSAGGTVPDSVFAQIAEDIARLDPAAKQAAEAAHLAADALRELQDVMDEGARITEENLTPLERYVKQIERLNQLLQKGAISDVTFERATKKAFEDMEGPVKKVKTIADELGLAFTSAFEDAIVGGKGLRDILKGIEADITRIIVRKLVTEPAAEWITGAIKGLGGGGSAGGGFLSGIGDWLSKAFSGWFADGGYIPPGRWGMAGERGPEPVFGGRTGATVRPYSGAITINVSVPGNTDGRTAQQVAVAAARAVAVAQRRGA